MSEDDWTNYVTTADGVYVSIEEAEAELTRLKEENEQNKKRYADTQKSFAEIMEENEKLRSDAEQQDDRYTILVRGNESLKSKLFSWLCPKHDLGQEFAECTCTDEAKRIAELERLLRYLKENHHEGEGPLEDAINKALRKDG